MTPIVFCVSRPVYKDHLCITTTLFVPFHVSLCLLYILQGDPNVPAGQISVLADLTRPMILTHEQQGSLDVLSAIDIPDVPPNTPLAHLTPQPFIVPQNCVERSPQPPRTCRYRYYTWTLLGW